MNTPNRFLRRKAVLAKVGISSTHLFNLEKAGRFPQHIMLTARCAVWSEAEVDAWMNERLAAAKSAVSDQTPAEKRRDVSSAPRG